MQYSPVYKQREWIHLISKNQNKSIDHDISRLINSFLYSRKEETTVTKYIVDTIHGFINQKVGIHENCIYLSDAPNVPLALVRL
jgi:hypothetical protein